MPARRALTLLATALLLAACGGAADDAAGAAASSAPAAVASEATSEPAATMSEVASEGSEATGGANTLEASETDLGVILVDGEGMTVYVFDNDAGGTSSCTGECETNWPPVSGDITAAASVEADLLGTTERDDGSSQATYDDRPLYYFAGDEAAGDTNGQGVGEVWWVVGVDGAKITDEAAAVDLSY